MRSCCRWNDKLEYELRWNEFIIEYKNKKVELLKFLVEHKYQMIILDVPFGMLSDFFVNGLDLVAAIVNEKKYYAYNLKVRFPNFERLEDEMIKKLRKAMSALDELDVPYYYNTPIDSWDVLMGHVCMGVSDVLIVNELGFSLDKVRDVVGDTVIRCYPNVAQSRWDGTPGKKCFWIRPEDMMAYDTFVDVLEFFQLPGNASETDVNILYDTYFLKGKWAGDLSGLILYYEGKLDSNYVIPQFPIRRATCGKKCYQGMGCHICDDIEKLSETLGDKGFIPFQEKDSDEPEWERIKN